MLVQQNNETKLPFYLRQYFVVNIYSVSKAFLPVLVSFAMCDLQVKTVEVVGRRSLLLLGFGGMFVFYAVMTISFRYEVGEWFSVALSFCLLSLVHTCTVM